MKYWVCEIKLLKVVVICVTFLFRLIFLTVVYVRAVQVCMVAVRVCFILFLRSRLLSLLKLSALVSPTR